jgi:hypothetical protein
MLSCPFEASATRIMLGSLPFQEPKATLEATKSILTMTLFQLELTTMHLTDGQLSPLVGEPCSL